MLKAIRLIALVSVLAACSAPEPTGLPAQFRETPFRHLKGVELGMPAARLRATRPAAKYAAYMGMEERIPGYSVGYKFSNAVSDGADAKLADAAVLEGIYIYEEFVSRDDADKAWYDKVREVSAGHRAPTGCLSLPSGGRQARWATDKSVFVIAAYPRDPTDQRVADRVVYGLALLNKVPQPQGATTITCPTT